MRNSKTLLLWYSCCKLEYKVTWFISLKRSNQILSLLCMITDNWKCKQCYGNTNRGIFCFEQWMKCCLYVHLHLFRVWCVSEPMVIFFIVSNPFFLLSSLYYNYSSHQQNFQDGEVKFTCQRSLYTGYFCIGIKSYCTYLPRVHLWCNLNVALWSVIWYRTAVCLLLIHDRFFFFFSMCYQTGLITSIYSGASTLATVMDSKALLKWKLLIRR